MASEKRFIQQFVYLDFVFGDLFCKLSEWTLFKRDSLVIIHE